MQISIYNMIVLSHLTLYVTLLKKVVPYLNCILERRTKVNNNNNFTYVYHFTQITRNKKRIKRNQSKNCGELVL